jgi:PAS domain S-box-containing protein
MTNALTRNRDRSASKTIESEMFENEQALTALTIQPIYAIVMTGAEESIIWVNSAFNLLTGWRSEEVIGKKPASLLGEKGKDPSVPKLLRKFQRKEHFSYERINYTRGGRRCWAQIEGQPLFTESGEYQGFIVIARDVTAKVLKEGAAEQQRLARQRKFTAAMLDAQEKERAFLWTTLQGNLAQHLIVAKFYLEMAKTDVVNRENCLDKSCRNVTAVIETIKQICKSLVSPETCPLGLKESIDNLVDDIIEGYPIDVVFGFEGFREEELPERVHLDIFRIVQEQLHNIVQHANATRVDMTFFRQQKRIVLVIADNGQGHEPSREKEGLGIINMRSRVESQGGQLDILSGPGQGYILRVELPLVNS